MVITQGGFDTRGDRNLTLQNLSDQHPISPFHKTAKSFFQDRKNREYIANQRNSDC